MTPGEGGSGYSALELQPFDISRDILSDILEVDLPSEEGEGCVVAVRATARACENEWAAHAAVALAGIWAAHGARVLLVDLYLGEPHLHRVFGARNIEGIVDALEYGASLRRIARPANGGAYWVATGGTPVANPRLLLVQPRWRRLLETLVDGGITVVTYQPAEWPVHPRGTSSIVLAVKGEPMAALGKVGLRDAIALLGPAPTGSSRRENDLGKQAYHASLWDGFEDEAADIDALDPATAGKRTSAASAPAGSGSRVRGRGLSVLAFTVLVLFAMLMTLIGISNAGIVEVPWVSRLWELFERLLARISQLFV